MNEEYHQTHFIAELEREISPDHSFIIIAHNPSGEITPDEINDENNTLLLEAITLGKQFRQDALYEICEDQVALVDCKVIEADEMVGKWSELQAPTS
jgi:hypothetical protein